MLPSMRPYTKGSPRESLPNSSTMYSVSTSAKVRTFEFFSLVFLLPWSKNVCVFFQKIYYGSVIPQFPNSITGVLISTFRLEMTQSWRGKKPIVFWKSDNNDIGNFKRRTEKADWRCWHAPLLKCWQRYFPDWKFHSRFRRRYWEANHAVWTGKLISCRKVSDHERDAWTC